MLECDFCLFSRLCAYTYNRIERASIVASVRNKWIWRGKTIRHNYSFKIKIKIKMKMDMVLLALKRQLYFIKKDDMLAGCVCVWVWIRSFARSIHPQTHIYILEESNFHIICICNYASLGGSITFIKSTIQSIRIYSTFKAVKLSRLDSLSTT